jgi:glucose/arabinose dehydrogenase
VRQHILAPLAMSAVVALATVACAGNTRDAPRRAGAAPTTTTTSVAPSSAPASAPPSSTTSSVPRVDRVSLRRVATFDQPTAMAWSPDGSHAYLAERAGRLWEVRVEGTRLVKVGHDPALDLTGRVESGNQEQGLLGVAVTPDGGALVVDFIEKGGTAGTTVVERYDLADGRPVASSRSSLLRVDQPFDNHNGGQVVFGPDGMLYIGLGDGGSEGDPQRNGQNRGVLLGKILRLRVEGPTASVPPDNPFVGHAGMRAEIWLYGVRNPWRFSFDSNGDLWVGDVGQDQREEVDHLPATNGRDAGKGLNLGWSAREGTLDVGHPVEGSTPVDPVFEYSHDDGCSITGGFVYRGTKIAGLVGDYVFSDYCAGTIWALDSAGAVRSLHASIDSPSSFARAPDGELYVLGLEGEVAAIEPS